MGHFISRIGEKEANEEMVRSKLRLEEMLGMPIRHFCYPYGAADTAGEREYAMAKQLGFKTAVTTQLESNNAFSFWNLPRLMMDGPFNTSLKTYLARGLARYPRLVL